MPKPLSSSGGWTDGESCFSAEDVHEEMRRRRMEGGTVSEAEDWRRWIFQSDDADAVVGTSRLIPPLTEKRNVPSSSFLSFGQNYASQDRGDCLPLSPVREVSSTCQSPMADDETVTLLDDGTADFPGHLEDSHGLSFSDAVTRLQGRVSAAQGSISHEVYAPMALTVDREAMEQLRKVPRAVTSELRPATADLSRNTIRSSPEHRSTSMYHGMVKGNYREASATGMAPRHPAPRDVPSRADRTVQSDAGARAATLNNVELEDLKTEMRQLHESLFKLQSVVSGRGVSPPNRNTDKMYPSDRLHATEGNVPRLVMPDGMNTHGLRLGTETPSRRHSEHIAPTNTHSVALSSLFTRVADLASQLAEAERQAMLQMAARMRHQVVATRLYERQFQSNQTSEPLDDEFTLARDRDKLKIAIAGIESENDCLKRQLFEQSIRQVDLQRKISALTASNSELHAKVASMQGSGGSGAMPDDMLAQLRQNASLAALEIEQLRKQSSHIKAERDTLKVEVVELRRLLELSAKSSPKSLPGRPPRYGQRVKGFEQGLPPQIPNSIDSTSASSASPWVGGIAGMGGDGRGSYSDDRTTGLYGSTDAGRRTGTLHGTNDASSATRSGGCVRLDNSDQQIGGLILGADLGYTRIPRPRVFQSIARRSPRTSDAGQPEETLEVPSQTDEDSLTFSVLPVYGEVTYDPVRGDVIDEAVSRFTNSRANRILFTRVKDGVYLFGRLPVRIEIGHRKVKLKDSGVERTARLPIVAYNRREFGLGQFVEVHEDAEFEALDAASRQKASPLEEIALPLNLGGHWPMGNSSRRVIENRQRSSSHIEERNSATASSPIYSKMQPRHPQTRQSPPPIIPRRESPRHLTGGTRRSVSRGASLEYAAEWHRQHHPPVAAPVTTTKFLASGAGVVADGYQQQRHTPAATTRPIASSGFSQVGQSTRMPDTSRQSNHRTAATASRPPTEDSPWARWKKSLEPRASEKRTPQMHPVGAPTDRATESYNQQYANSSSAAAPKPSGRYMMAGSPGNSPEIRHRRVTPSPTRQGGSSSNPPSSLHHQQQQQPPQTPLLAGRSFRPPEGAVVRESSKKQQPTYPDARWSPVSPPHRMLPSMQQAFRAGNP